jgi:hypothetical protein
MTCKTECTQFDLAMELLIDNGFGGIAETVGLLMNTATQIERSRHLISQVKTLAEARKNLDTSNVTGCR